MLSQLWAVLSGPPGGDCGVLSRCVGAIDGIIIKTQSSTEKNTVQVMDFYSGHKKTVGLNDVQAVCGDGKK